MKAEQMKIFLAIPSADSKASIHTMSSAIRTQAGLLRQEIGMTFDSFSFAEVSVARNILAARFLESDCTHLLFCDADMSWEPQVVGDLISAQAPFVTAAYVQRGIDLEKYAAARKKLKPGPKNDENRQDALRAATKPVHVPMKPPTRKGRFIDVQQTGLGLALIERDVFMVMQTAGIVATQAYGAHFSSRDVYGYFDRIRLDDRGSTLPEDYSFCHRWRKCGGQIWVLEDARTRHHGEFTYQNW